MVNTKIVICPVCGYWEFKPDDFNAEGWVCHDCKEEDPYVFTEEDVKMGYEIVGKAFDKMDEDFSHIYTELYPTIRRLHDMLIKYHHLCRIGKFKDKSGDRISYIYLKLNCFDGRPFLMDKRMR